jgi:diadenosine tetraphosphate (Ap4A) HIT family hydrolase
MPETTEQLYERAKAGLREVEYATWDSFPFTGDLSPRPLKPPAEAEPPRHGAGGIDCGSCTNPDEHYLWTDEHWRLSAPKKPSGFPVQVFLQPRAHYADPGDLPDDLAASFGVVLARLERAVKAVGDIGRVHISRWGDGGEHLHWWIYGRPARLLQMRGTFAALWEDMLPRLPEDVWQDNLAIVAREMSAY